MLPAVHLYRASGADRVAIVSVVPSSTPDAWLLRVARGTNATMLGDGAVYGPIPTSALRARYDEALAALEADGFLRAGRGELIAQLGSSSSAIRARAAQRLGWRRDEASVAPLIASLSTAKRDAPSLLDALGRIGDPRAIPAVRPHAEKMLLSRRRSAVEALRTLGDTDGLALARQRGLERLPKTVVDALAALDEHDVRKKNLAPFLAVLDEVEPARRGLVADVLYEADTPATVAAARRLLRSVPFEQPHLWRYAKSIYKRAMLRSDERTFGWLSHAIEQRARISSGTKATLKSGLDGQTRETKVFAKSTQGYVRRLGWRYLRRLARWRPDLYAETAAEVLVAYGPEDRRPPKGMLGALAECYLLGRILYGGGERVRFDTRSMRMRYVSAKAVTPPPSAVREESYPELWDARPRAYLRLASAARLSEVLDFGAEGLRRHPLVLRDAGLKPLLGMLGGDHAAVRALALAELERRFDPEAPNLALLRRLLAHEAEAARELGVSFGERSAAAWAHRPDAVVELLLSASGGTGLRLAIAVANVLLAGDAATRHAIAAAVLEALRETEPGEGAHAALAELARRALLAELDAALDVDALVALLDGGSSAARAVAGALLGRRPDAFEALGLERLRAFAESELVAVRRGAHAVLEAAAAHFAEDPSPLFVVLESTWPDTRALAFKLLRGVGFERLGLDGVIGLLDSAHDDVRAFGRELTITHLEELDTQELLFRLVEHPARDMRAFALTLVESHLKPGFVALARIEGFCRAALMDLSPDRDVKVRLLAFLTARGLADERQAEVVVAILERVVRTHTRFDFERVLAALAAIQLAHPVASEVTLS